MKGGIHIPNGSDMKSNTYLVPGNYYCGSDDDSKTLVNSPFETAFVLKVEYSTGNAYPKQIFKSWRGPIATRVFDPLNSRWIYENEISLKSDFAVTNSSFSLASGVAQYFNNDITKYGRVAIYKLQTDKLSFDSVPGGNIIATVPPGFRPAITAIGIIPVINENNAGTAYNITPNGNVAVYGAIKNQQILISGAYITAG